MQQDNKIGRREVIAGLGAGLTSVMVAPVFAAGGSKNNNINATAGLEDPRNKYPKPPFKKPVTTLAGTRRQNGTASRSW